MFFKVTLMFGIPWQLCFIRFPLVCFSLRLQQRFSCKALLRFLKAMFFSSSLQSPFLCHSTRALWKQDTSFLRFHSSEGAVSSEQCFSSQSPPPATFLHHMIHPVLEKLGERSRRYAAWIPGKTGNIVLTNRHMPACIPLCVYSKTTENISLVLDIVYRRCPFSIFKKQTQNVN